MEPFLKQEMPYCVTKSMLLNGAFSKYKGQVHSLTIVHKHNTFYIVPCLDFYFVVQLLCSFGFLIASLFLVEKEYLYLYLIINFILFTY